MFEKQPKIESISHIESAVRNANSFEKLETLIRENWTEFSGVGYDTPQHLVDHINRFRNDSLEEDNIITSKLGLRDVVLKLSAQEIGEGVLSLKDSIQEAKTIQELITFIFESGEDIIGSRATYSNEEILNQITKVASLSLETDSDKDNFVTLSGKITNTFGLRDKVRQLILKSHT